MGHQQDWPYQFTKQQLKRLDALLGTAAPLALPQLRVAASFFAALERKTSSHPKQSPELSRDIERLRRSLQRTLATLDEASADLKAVVVEGQRWRGSTVTVEAVSASIRELLLSASVAEKNSRPPRRGLSGFVLACGIANGLIDARTPIAVSRDGTFAKCVELLWEFVLDERPEDVFPYVKRAADELFRARRLPPPELRPIRARRGRPPKRR